MSEIKRLYFDLETSPNVCFTWRTGYKINLDHDNIIHERAIICVCYKWEKESKVHALQWDQGDDRQLLIDFAPIINSADETASHNGNKFDIKWFNTRNLIHGLPPLPEYKNVDTLQIARQKFLLNSTRLDYLGKLLLGEGKIRTEFGLWKRIVLDNDPDAMAEMVAYCRKDVLLLQRIWEKLIVYARLKTHAGVLEGLGRWSCPHCGNEDVVKSKTRVTPVGIRQHQMNCRGGCHRYYSISDFVFRQYLEHRYGVEA